MSTDHGMRGMPRNRVLAFDLAGMLIPRDFAVLRCLELCVAGTYGDCTHSPPQQR